jgi:hypothetical protein
VPSDTLLGINPYNASRNRFLNRFRGGNYYMEDHKNIRFVALQTNANYDVAASTDYRVNNPTTYAAPTGGVTGYDYDGITVSSSPQRVFLRNALATRDKSHWFIVGGHRGTYGPRGGDDGRRNLGRAARGTGYINEVEDSLITGERCLFLMGDKHINVVLTQPIADSAVVSGTTKGGYHMMVSSGAGARSADTTGVFAGAWLMDILARKEASADPLTPFFGHTSTAWADTITQADGGKDHVFTWALFTVHADCMLVEVFRTFTTASAGHAQYRGAGNHRLITSRTIRRDLN